MTRNAGPFVRALISPRPIDPVRRNDSVVFVMGAFLERLGQYASLGFRLSRACGREHGSGSRLRVAVEAASPAQHGPVSLRSARVVVARSDVRPVGGTADAQGLGFTGVGGVAGSCPAPPTVKRLVRL